MFRGFANNAMVAVPSVERIINSGMMMVCSLDRYSSRETILRSARPIAAHLSRFARYVYASHASMESHVSIKYPSRL
jgi:hypothetical protein